MSYIYNLPNRPGFCTLTEEDSVYMQMVPMPGKVIESENGAFAFNLLGEKESFWPLLKKFQFKNKCNEQHQTI